jgi:hypothetical protein
VPQKIVVQIFAQLLSFMDKKLPKANNLPNRRKFLQFWSPWRQGIPLKTHFCHFSVAGALRRQAEDSCIQTNCKYLLHSQRAIL